MEYYIYVYQNLVNGKRYYGKGKNDRISKLNRGRSLLSRAVKKYGIKNFHVYKLYEGLSESESFTLERDCIERYKTNVHRFGPHAGYNQTDGGDGKSGWKATQQTCEKISRALKGKPLTYPVWNQGKTLSESHKRAVSQSLKGKKRIPYTRRPASLETRQKISASVKAYFASRRQQSEFDTVLELDSKNTEESHSGRVHPP